MGYFVIISIYRICYSKKILGLAKNTDKILTAIEESKKNPPAKLLTGLGILGVGSAAAKDLIQHFGGILQLADATVDDLKNVHDIGEDPGSKLTKANELGIKVLSEEDFEVLISQ